MEKTELMDRLWKIIEIWGERDDYYKKWHSKYESEAKSYENTYRSKLNESVTENIHNNGPSAFTNTTVSSLILTLIASFYYTTIDHWLWAVILFIPTLIVAAIISFIVVFPISIMYETRWEKRRKQEFLRREQEFRNSEEYKRSLAEIEKKVKEANERLHNSQLQYENINQRLERALEEATYLPATYRYLNAVNRFYSYLLDKRVDTLKECINLYETELYHEEMKRKQDELIYQQEIAHQEQQAQQQAQFKATLQQMEQDAKIKNKHLKELEESNKRIQKELEYLSYRDY